MGESGLLRLSTWLELVSEWTGRVVAWLMLPMVAGTFVVVVLRYVFDFGRIWMQESVMWLHAAVFMLAAAYTLRRDDHVRVDIFYRELDPRRKAWVDILGTLFLLLPMMSFLIWSSLDYVGNSWRIGEKSPEAGGLGFYLVPMLKSLIPATAVLVIVQGIATALANLGRLLGNGHGTEGGL